MFDIIIIGSGPAGMTAAIYARRASLDALVLEKDAMGSGQIAVTEQVDNYPGLPRIGGYELGEKFREHAEELGASFSENEVAALTKTDGIFTVFMKDGTSVTGKSVIYAAGTSYRTAVWKFPGVSSLESPTVRPGRRCVLSEQDRGSGWRRRYGAGGCAVPLPNGEAGLSGAPQRCIPCQCLAAKAGGADGKYCARPVCGSH